MWKLLASTMMTNSTYGNRKLMELLRYLKIQRMSHLAVARRSDCTLKMKQANIWMRVN
uniref:Uncharacterized protein n=1 Tax=Picea sitchensis TaxID=3332 RepID=A9NVR1_PICSI|nr:unknown [Picea sitchensis]